MPFLVCLQPLKKISHNNSYEYLDSSFKFNISEKSSYQSFEENLEYPEGSKQKFNFNFNPKEGVSAFIPEILRVALDKTKLDKFKDQQLELDCLQAKYRQEFDKEKKYYFQQQINNLSCRLKLESMQVIEKLKLTFKGFDICEQAMPLELLHPRKDVLADTILFLIRQGYVNAQIISLFDLSLEQYEALSRKGPQRDKLENNKFEAILTFVDRTKSLIRLTQANAETQDKIAILQELKAIGAEGKKAYFLLRHLLNYNPEASEFIRF